MTVAEQGKEMRLAPSGDDAALLVTLFGEIASYPPRGGTRAKGEIRIIDASELLPRMTGAYYEAWLDGQVLVLQEVARDGQRT